MPFNRALLQMVLGEEMLGVLLQQSFLARGDLGAWSGETPEAVEVKTIGSCGVFRQFSNALAVSNEGLAGLPNAHASPSRSVCFRRRYVKLRSFDAGHQDVLHSCLLPRGNGGLGR